MYNQLNQLQNVLGGLGQGLAGQFMPYPDKRPIRIRLEEKLKLNNEQIEILTNKNKEIEELLKNLDEHPFVEKFQDLVNKIF